MLSDRLEIKKQQRKTENAVSWNRLLTSREYTQRRLTFGKYVNWQIKDLPIEYVKWAVINLRGIWAEYLARELQRREPKWKK